MATSGSRPARESATLRRSIATGRTASSWTRGASNRSRSTARQAIRRWALD